MTRGLGQGFQLIAMGHHIYLAHLMEFISVQDVHFHKLLNVKTFHIPRCLGNEPFLFTEVSSSSSVWSEKSETIQANFNGSNTLGTMKICSRQG